ncbi:hypothetical protein CLV59_108271 [Chitinophaga dinghuensis]|uniref:TonB-like protein n=1 Tax=Chitinophaga dinghuensis TaxID=1539050 RepID=A0A327VRS2_9BACT|nr:hypothetical protein [Chitinophaga dinghuensis]RAJ76750.1 hypothetical protein CLV59_108271 [Chitinophaga dinghuensis]
MLNSPRRVSLFCWTVAMFMGCLLTASSGNAQQRRPDTTLANVGDIPFDKTLDDSTFHVCEPGKTFQYYNEKGYYLRHKPLITKFILDKYKFNPGFENQNGYITIRFVINCEGHTGRFRIKCIDEQMHPATFPDSITHQLLEALKQYKDWQPMEYEHQTHDSYQYITFHIRKGKIITISP